MIKLTDREKKFLLEIARESIRSWISSQGFRYEPPLQPIISLDRPYVLEDAGALIILTKDGEVISSYPKYDPKYPLYLVVRDIAIELANTSRIRSDEFNTNDIELSVTTPYQKINSIDEFNLGQHGIRVGKNGVSFIPTDMWKSKEEFLDHCAQGVDWRKSDLFKFEVITFSEKQFGLR